MIVALLSDIHANLMALLAVTRDLEQVEEERSCTIDAVWCMGDIAGYGPHLSAVLLKILGSKRAWFTVRGNHDDALLRTYEPGRPSDERGDGPDQGIRHAALKAIRLQSAEVSPAHRGIQWLKTLPDTLLAHEGVLLIHPNDERHGVDTSSTPDESVLSVEREHGLLHTRFAPRVRTFTVIRGHTHTPACFVRHPDEKAWRRLPCTDIVDLGERHAWLNPGSVGESRVSTDPRAHYALLDVDTRRIEFRRVAYPIRPVRFAARSAGYEVLPAWRSTDSPR